MTSNVVKLRPPAASAAAIEREPLEVAFREVSQRVAETNDRSRSLNTRARELAIPSLRRRRERPTPPAMSEPVTFYSIEVAEASASAPRRAARGGR